MAKIVKQSFVWFSDIYWDFHWQRQQEFAHRFAANNKVLFVQPLGAQTLTITELLRKHKQIVPRLLGLMGRSPMQSQPHEGKAGNLVVFFPFILPVHSPDKTHPVRRLNKLLLCRQIQTQLRRYELWDPILWTYYPTDNIVDMLDCLNFKLVIYDCMAAYETITEKYAYTLQMEQELLKKADLVFALSDKVYSRCSQVNRNVHQLRQGVNIDRYASIPPETEKPKELAHIKRPIIGYVGGIMRRCFDLALLEKIGTEHPDWSVILIGEAWIDISKFSKYTNIHFLGKKAYEDIPRYIHAFDVCILPYMLNEFTEHVYPTKLLEYFACGKPVVAYGIPEVRKLAPLVSIVNDREQFIEAIEYYLTEGDSKEERIRRIEYARANTWEKKFEMVENEIMKLLVERRRT